MSRTRSCSHTMRTPPYLVGITYRCYVAVCLENQPIRDVGFSLQGWKWNFKETYNEKSILRTPRCDPSCRPPRYEPSQGATVCLSPLPRSPSVHLGNVPSNSRTYNSTEPIVEVQDLPLLYDITIDLRSEIQFR